MKVGGGVGRGKGEEVTFLSPSHYTLRLFCIMAKSALHLFAQ